MFGGYFASAEETKAQQPELHLSDVHSTMASGHTMAESSMKDISTHHSSTEEHRFGFEEEEEEPEADGVGSYFATALGILIDEKIDYTIDGMNYAIDALSNAVGMNLTCGYEADEQE